MKWRITFLLLICLMTVKAQLKLEDLSDKKESGLALLQRLELNILSVIPTVNDYKNFDKIIKNLPPEYIKYVDSIDYTDFNKKLSIVQIYSQERVYQSKNSYQIKQMSENDSLLLVGVNYDMKMKSHIIEFTEYEGIKTDFDYKITKKIVYTKKPVNRIIFSKPTIENLLKQK